MHLRSGHLVHNLEVTATIDPNSSNVIRNIQEQLQLMRAEMSNMSNKMNNLSRRVESKETLQLKQYSKSEHFTNNYRNRQRPVPCKNHHITTTRVTMTLTTLTIVSILAITIKDQFTLRTISTTTIKVITTTMTLMSEL
jgi:recombination DNA repair RAD52 pathway protein